MLKVFRTDVYMQAVIIGVTVVLLWAGAIVMPFSEPIEGGGALYYLLTGWMPRRALAVAGMVLAVLEGLMLNGMLYRNKMVSQNTLLPMLFFVVAISLGSSNSTLTPLLFGTGFLIICTGQLMVTGTLLSLPIDKTFGAAASLSLATLFCPAAVVFAIPLIFCMFNYSLYTWRDWTMLLLGLAAPYIPLELCYYLSGDMFYQNYLLLYDLTNFGTSAAATTPAWIMSCLFALLTLVAMGFVGANSQSHGTNYKKNSAVMLFFVVGGLLYGIYTGFIPAPTQALAIPFAFCCTDLFYDTKKKEWIWNILLAAILLLAATYNLWR